MKREFLMLAQKLDPVKHRANGWYCSEKLDGIRCFWDGGVTRGMSANQVPWCNVTKHGRFVNPVECTGLWTRYGQPIQAPGYWLNDLPSLPLDGELTMGPSSWQQLSSCIKCRVPDERWLSVRYMAFGSPPFAAVFADGRINGTNFKKTFAGILAWLEGCEVLGDSLEPGLPFYKELAAVRRATEGHKYVRTLEQEQLPSDTQSTNDRLGALLNEVENHGGEGLVLRSPVGIWKPERSWDLLKLKRVQDMEGVVVGYKWAKPTDLDRSLTGESTDKLLGLMGSLRLRLDSGIEFDLSGFTDLERVLVFKDSGESASAFACPGEEVGAGVESRLFPRGCRVTFRYRELSSSGVPKEARYWRRRLEDL